MVCQNLKESLTSHNNLNVNIPRAYIIDFNLLLFFFQQQRGVYATIYDCMKSVPVRFLWQLNIGGQSNEICVYTQGTAC